MNHFVLQNKVTGGFIFTEHPLTHTVNFDNALLFKESVLKDKLKQYHNYRILP